MFFRMTSVAVALALMAISAQAGEFCASCKLAFQSRLVTQVFPADKSVDCFRVELPDQYDSASVTIFHGDDSYVISLRRGAFVLFGGKGSPALCLLPSITKTATKIVVIPGSKETCLTLDVANIARLRREHLIEDKGCLSTPGWCAAN